MRAAGACGPLASFGKHLVGWDGGRLAMILAVLEARAASPCGLDVYLNVAGGMKISEPRSGSSGRCGAVE